MQYWSDLYKELAQKITDNLSEIRWCDLWHEQVSYLTEELPFPTPAVFITFNMSIADDVSLKTQNCDTQIDFYLFYETFSDSYIGSINQAGAIDFLNQLTELHKLFHATSGTNYSEMRRVGMGREDSGGAGNLYRISFQCAVNDASAQTDYKPKDVQDITIIRGVEGKDSSYPDSNYSVETN